MKRFVRMGIDVGGTHTKQSQSIMRRTKSSENLQ